MHFARAVRPLPRFPVPDESRLERSALDSLAFARAEWRARADCDSIRDSFAGNPVGTPRIANLLAF